MLVVVCTFLLATAKATCVGPMPYERGLLMSVEANGVFRFNKGSLQTPAIIYKAEDAPAPPITP